jgi:hypothetical protein
MAPTSHDLWLAFAAPIVERLGDDDDLAFWHVAVETIVASTEADAEAYSGKDCIVIKVGCCSHWIQPHWQDGAGTAWPYGYGNIGQGFAYASLPQFDWSLQWSRDADTSQWQLSRGQPTRRPLIRRIAVPARTARHPQATVHTIWTPGSPRNSTCKVEIVYGVAKSGGDWALRDQWHRERN